MSEIEQGSLRHAYGHFDTQPRWPGYVLPTANPLPTARYVRFSECGFLCLGGTGHIPRIPFERLSGFGKSAPNQLRYGMRHFRPPLLALVVLVVASFFSGIIHAQSVRGPTQDNGNVLVNPTCVRCPDPPLTRSERLRDLEGVVLLQATVTARGRAEQIEVVKGLESGLANRALAAVRRWRFRPAIGKDGKPTAARIPILVIFGLRKKGGGIATG